VKLDLSQTKNEEAAQCAASFSIASADKPGKQESEVLDYYKMAPPLIGSDEAGKGDYFGFLCVAAVYADKMQYQKLRMAGVCDSKHLTDIKIAVLAEQIRDICPNHSVVTIPNVRFNEEYRKVQNINAVLGSAHGKVIRDVIEKTGCKRVLTDKFGNTHWVEDALRGTGAHLVQEPKAEQNLAVAAASILARKAFVDSVEQLRTSYGFDFPLGAGSVVDECGRRFVERFGLEKLNEVAKISFKNTEKIMMMVRGL